MDHLNVSTFPQRASITTEHSSNASRNTSNQLVHPYDNKLLLEETLTNSKSSCFPFLSSSVKRTVFFSIFTIISIIIAVIVVCLTSPEPPSVTCRYIIKSEAEIFINADSYPNGMATGDFNNDGRIDIVTANSGTNKIGLFLRDDAQTFQNQITYSTGSGSRPYSVTVADFNRDEQLDAAVANYGTNSIGIFFGNGNGSLTFYKTFPLRSSRPQWIDHGDFNHDTFIDLVVINNGTNNIGILFGDGLGNFAEQVTYSTGFDSESSSLAVNHFNNDNNLDIIVTNRGTNTLLIFLGHTNGTFANPMSFYTGMNTHPYAIAVNDLNNDKYMDFVVTYSGTNQIGVFLGFVVVGDFNNDDQLDIAVGNYDIPNIGVFYGNGTGLFAAQAVFYTNIVCNPHLIATDDFNNDTQLDIAIVNYDYNYLDIVLAHKNYAYSKQISYPTTGGTSGSCPQSVAVGDLNNDHRLDMVVENYCSSTVDIFLGDNNGNFVKTKTYSTGNSSGPYFVAVSDLNNDQQLDILVTNYDVDNIGILYNDGNATFRNIVTYPTGDGSYPYSLAVGDLNNDNRSDVVVANYNSDNIGIFFADANGNFNEQITYSTGHNSGPQMIAVGHFNEDSYLDIAVVCQYSSSLNIFLMENDGVFSKQNVYPLGASIEPNSLATGDLNEDGYLDVVVTTLYGRNIHVLIGSSDGTFRNVAIYSTGSGSRPYSCAITDWNNDQHLDIVVSNCLTDNIVLFEGYGNGTFSLEQNYSTGTGSCPMSIAFGYFNDDSLVDIAVTNHDSDTLGVFLGYTYMNGKREATYSTGSASQPRAVALGNFNSDDYLDIVMANYGLGNIDILLGHANATFSMQTTFSTGVLSFPTSLAIGDVDNDEKLDVIIGNSGTESILIYYGYENENFTRTKVYSTGVGSSPQSLAIGDFNNDRKLDIAVVNSGANNALTLMKYDMGAFRQQVSHSLNEHSSPHSVRVGDFNNDNRLDFVVVNRDSSSIAVFLGQGNGTFSNQTTYSTGERSNSWAVTTADLTNDSYIDIIVSNYWQDYISIFLGLGNGTFSNEITCSTGDDTGSSDTAVGDFNDDAQLDIVVSLQFSYKICILYGYGNGTFSYGEDYSTGSDSYPSSVVTADLNLDGYLDIVVANYGTWNLYVYYGQRDGTLIRAFILSTGSGSSPQSLVIDDFNKDGRLDIAVANSGTDNVGIFFGAVNSTFLNQITLPTGKGSAPYGISVGDFNDDTQLDIAVANYGSNSLGILLGCINGTFFNQLTYKTGDYSQPWSVAVADFDNDHRLDVVIANLGTNNVGVFLDILWKIF
ncbi:unnamed protein product [Adineta ricciae]|uniref:Uncharacterized protein n=1 Tax=Adineta ricciae TaxID=249248 RepID=A0A814XKR9_ADIRI|nr:unnamed protein product [Adineta ricciae]CAF1217421.1 unnamed protein product [Adineta ricciae]